MLRPVAALAGISIVMVLIALDQTVVGTALPQMVAELQGFRLYPWVAAAYLLGNAILIPVIGRLGDLHGRKPYLLVSIALFTLASVLCGMAHSMLQLVLARGLQGIAGGMLMGSAFASVSDLFPDTLERVRWQVMLSAAFGVASALGPALGGWMTEHLGWRSVFYVNLPVGLLALPIVWRYLPWIKHGEQSGKALDWPGVLLLTLAVGTLLLTTEMGEQLGFASLAFWGLMALSCGLGALFVQHQRHSEAPVIPPHLFANPAVRRLAVLALLTGLILFVLLFYAPLLLQGGFSLSPNEAGLVVTPLLVFITIGSVVNGRLIPRIAKPERLFSYGVLGLIASILGLCFIGADMPRAFLMSVFAVCGFSLGFQLPNLTLQIQASVGRADQGAASALIQTLRTLGSMFGASLAGLAVSIGFSRGAGAMLAESGISDTRVLQLFGNPQLLVRATDQHELARLATALSFDAERMLEHARLGLVSGIHAAFFGCAVLAVITYIISRRLPPFARKSEGAPD
ncbi:MAG: MFS transporter [Rhodocyclaceae bacterium]|nr:MFS transporter [Rhodocyclaceae bacterium]